MKPEQMIGKQIRAIRESQGMTQEDLGVLLGSWLKQPWPRQAVSGAERGERAFTSAELLAIAHVLQTWVGALVTPSVEVDKVDMPSGKALSPSEATRIARDPEARNVPPIAAEAIAGVGNWLSEVLAGGSIEMRKLRNAYEAIAPGAAPLPDDGLRAREADLDEFVRQAHGLVENEEKEASDGQPNDQAR